MRPSRRAAAALFALGCLAFAQAAGAKGPGVVLAEAAQQGTWVARPNEPLRLLDHSSGRAIAAMPAGLRLTDLAARYGTVWGVSLEGRLVRVDETAPRAVGRRVTGRRRLPVDLAWSVEAGDVSVWVVGVRREPRFEAVLLRIDPRTMRVAGTFHLGTPEPPALALGRRGVWLAMNASTRRGDRTTLVAIDERRGRLRLRRRIAGAPIGLASGHAGVWLLTRRGGRATRLTLVEELGGNLVRSVPAAAGASRLAVGSDLVWVASAAGRPLRATLRGYDETSARLVSGPWPLACGSRRRPALAVDLLAGPDTAVVAVADDRGRARLATVTVRRGVRGCVPLAR
jgi:hypothetical protein